jgi:ferritin
MFEELYKHEVFVSNAINELHIALTKGLCVTQLLQWFVAEQIEEEAQAKNILDKIHLIGDDKRRFILI